MMANFVSSVPPPKLVQLIEIFKLFFNADEYSLVVTLNLQLQQLDLSSLETISGGGLFFFNNPQLCYVGNFRTYLDNPTAQHQCVVSPFRKDPRMCCEYIIITQLPVCANNGIHITEYDTFNLGCVNRL